MAVEGPGNNELKNSCFLQVQFRPPRNLNVRDISRYIIEYQSVKSMITSDTSVTFTVYNCTHDIQIRVTAVNRCYVQGNSTPNIVPIFLPPSKGVETVTIDQPQGKEFCR